MRLRGINLMTLVAIGFLVLQGVASAADRGRLRQPAADSPAIAAVGEHERDSDAECRACRGTAWALQNACVAAANEDYWMAIARCENIADPDEREACKKEAREAKREALRDCRAQLQARLGICKILGEAPYDPEINPEDFTTAITNPYFPLKPGTTYFFEKKSATEVEEIKVEVTDETKEILGVRCVVVKDTVTVDGQLREDTLDWYAQDKAGNVWYFGELSLAYEDGELVGLGGSWEAGVDDAKPGIVMLAKPEVGTLYRQEFAPGVAEDMGQVLNLSESGVAVPFGVFDNCLVTKDFSPMEPAAVEHKYYAPGIGVVLIVDVETGEREELVNVIAK